MQFHHDASARQAAGDDRAGLASVRHGQHEFLLDRASARRLRRGGLELDPRRGPESAEASGQR